MRDLDKKLRKEQAGFRSKRSTKEQIFIVRNILEQANEWMTSLYVQYFVDSEKAFDSVHRESLWNIMKSFGIPLKMVRVIEGMMCLMRQDGESDRRHILGLRVCSC